MKYKFTLRGFRETEVEAKTVEEAFNKIEKITGNSKIICFSKLIKEDKIGSEKEV